MPTVGACGRRRGGRRRTSSSGSRLGDFVLERVEELEQLIADPFSVAPTADPRPNEHTCILQSVQRGPGSSGCDPVAVGGDLSANDGLRRQTNDDPPGNGIGARVTRSTDQFTQQLADLCPQRPSGSGGSCERISECPDPVVGAGPPGSRPDRQCSGEPTQPKQDSLEARTKASRSGGGR